MRRVARLDAFTLVELLVVIAITAVLIGLLLPAVQKIRGAMARIQCQNNLKQLGLALHSHHDTRDGFPAGSSVESGRSPQPYLSWLARILPFVEQETLWREVERAFAQDRDFLSQPHRRHRATVVPVFTCPSDARADRPSSKLLSQQVAFTSYLGVAGTTSAAHNGILFLDSRVRIRDITDGTSHTLVAGERPPSSDERYGWWYAGWGQKLDGSAEVYLGVADYNLSEASCFRGPYRFGPGSVSNLCDTFHFWSFHAGGGNFLFADGSVSRLPYSAATSLSGLSTRARGETVSAD